jgi:hypothetical protein
MKLLFQRALLAALVCAGVAIFSAAPAAAQTIPPSMVPVVVDTAAPIVINAVKPKPKPLPAGILKFEGYVQNANSAQITVKALGNDMALQTFSLSADAAAKMQQIIDKGGYQYGDRVTVIYNSVNQVALKIKGKPSRPQ